MVVVHDFNDHTWEAEAGSSGFKASLVYKAISRTVVTSLRNKTKDQRKKSTASQVRASKLLYKFQL